MKFQDFRQMLKEVFGIKQTTFPNEVEVVFQDELEKILEIVSSKFKKKALSAISFFNPNTTICIGLQISEYDEFSEQAIELFKSMNVTLYLRNCLNGDIHTISDFYIGFKNDIFNSKNLLIKEIKNFKNISISS